MKRIVWELGLVGALAYGTWKLVQSSFKPNIPGLEWQPPNLTEVEIHPHDRGSINLTFAPDPNKQLLQFVRLLLAPGGEVTFTPASGVISVSAIASGVVVTATGKGSALVTIVFPPDTTGQTDALIGIGVF